MRLEGIIAQAASGLEATQRRLGLVGQNVANAQTAGYVRQTMDVQAVNASGIGMGVRTGVSTRVVDPDLQAEVFAAVGDQAGGALRQAALNQIDLASGVPGDGQDLAGLLGSMRDAFSTLLNDPGNVTQQRAVVASANAFVSGLHAVAQAISGGRQTAQDGLVGNVAEANAALNQIGSLSDRIMQAQSRGESTADLEDMRDAAMRQAAELTGARFIPQVNGDVLAERGGSLLPLRAAQPLSVARAVLTPASAGPPLLLNGQPATMGGRIGAAMALRDAELPQLQAKLDQVSFTVADGFASVGLPLFTQPDGTLPVGATPGLAQDLRASSAVADKPSMVRDGTAPAGPAGRADLINAVLNGPLSTGATSVRSQAAQFTGDIAQRVAAGQNAQDLRMSVRDTLQAKLDKRSGVSVDSELTQMVQLQNSYAANAKVISTVQSLWSDVMGLIR